MAEHYDLPYFSLRVYLSEHPNVSVRFVRDGVEHDLAEASDDPALVKPVPAIKRKLFALRAVDQQSPGAPSGVVPACAVGLRECAVTSRARGG